jgi:hypothetical protein
MPLLQLDNWSKSYNDHSFAFAVLTQGKSNYIFLSIASTVVFAGTAVSKIFLPPTHDDEKKEIVFELTENSSILKEDGKNTQTFKRERTFFILQYIFVLF